MIIVSLLALYLPVRVLPQMDERRRKQIGYFYVGCFLYGFWSFTVSVALPFFGNFNLSNLDTPSTIFLTGFVSYSIIKYQIMDIKYLILKAFIYALLIGLISSFLAILLSLESWFFENYGVSSVYLITAFVSIIIFLIGRSFYIKTKDLELAKNSLTQLLEKSEENRLKAEVEKNKTLAIIKNFSDGLLILDKSRRIIIVNQAMENYLGFEASGLLGKKLGAKSLAKVSRLNLLSLSILGREKELRKKEIEFSSNQIMELSTVRLKFEKKNNGLLVILHDVTSRRNIERLKSEFVTLAAHQMRTPLTAIRWSSQMFLKGDLGVLNDEQQEYLQKIEISSSRMIKLINDLLDVGHLDDGNYVLNVSSFKVSDVFSVVMSNLKEKIEQKKIETNILFPDFELPLISADREKIGIVMQNLIENAINYSKEGGKIAIAVDCNQENWSFKVEDSGIGISEKSKGRIFGKFFRSEEAFKQSTEGSGLGLFMCKNIIESHGGRIGFESVEGLGSTFFFSLPLKAYVKLK
jgi:two-component system phosphate regulon sensor histidine kinase PhoR